MRSLWGLKPIFHQNAKYLASGTFASPNAKDSIFASPNAKNSNMLVSIALGDANFLRWPCTFHFLCVDFFALGSKRKPHFQWNIGCVWSLALGLCVGHVHLIFFCADFICVGHPTQTRFLVEYGLNNQFWKGSYIEIFIERPLKPKNLNGRLFR